MTLRLLLAVGFALTLGCAHQRALQKNDQTICPEYRDLTCIGAPECTMDSTRGCRVCQCPTLGGDQAFTPTSDPNYVPRH